MNRKLKVGDLVIATDEEETVIGRITKTGRHIVKVEGSIFHKSSVIHREYRDQFSPWNESSLRDNDSTIRYVANELVIMMEQ